MNNANTMKPKWKNVGRLFPIEKNVDINQIKCDDESLDYVTLREAAEKTSQIILSHTGGNRCLLITDATACVGGNTLSFCKEFALVRAIELNPSRAEDLANNIGQYGFHNCTVEQGDCTKLLFNREQDVVYIDPPWGGIGYKNKDSIRIELSGTSLEDLCLRIIKTATRIVVLKLPVNYDFQYLWEKLGNVTRLYRYDFNKMYIVVVHRRMP
jgi:16S rRNA G966 N2-methylase RsmD